MFRFRQLNKKLGVQKIIGLWYYMAMLLHVKNAKLICLLIDIP
jgi:Na+/H+ antiporter NhaB